ncbi:MAG: carbohydrate ABC transporter permease [Candidatus Sumerlaeota bacterium]|nr:carbohydrate ABC transporter permease [Candidatus Sumerlaeota bacterium]
MPVTSAPKKGSSGAVNTVGVIGKIALYAVLLFFSFMYLFPFAWMLTTSIKDITQAMRMPPEWIPNPFKWNNYLAVGKYIPFWLYARNTAFICVMNVMGTTLSCALIAYGFSRIEWPGRDKVFALTLATMMIPFPVLMVPQYVIFLKLGWVGTYMPLWVPSFFGSAWNIFLLRQFFMTLPKELSEAAEIDGCSHWRIFWQIIVPLSKPALLVVALFCFMYHWRDFMGPLIYLTNQSQFTLALGLQSFQTRQGGTEMNLLMAASTMMITPILVLFFFTQRAFIQGISMTGIKG